MGGWLSYIMWWWYLLFLESADNGNCYIAGKMEIRIQIKINLYNVGSMMVVRSGGGDGNDDGNK